MTAGKDRHSGYSSRRQDTLKRLILHRGGSERRFEPCISRKGFKWSARQGTNYVKLNTPKGRGCLN